MDLFEFKTSLVYKVSSRTARTTQRNTVSKTQKKIISRTMDISSQNSPTISYFFLNEAEVMAAVLKSLRVCLPLLSSQFLLPSNSPPWPLCPRHPDIPQTKQAHYHRGDFAHALVFLLPKKRSSVCRTHDSLCTAF